MEYTMTKPCGDCPFLSQYAHAFPKQKLKGFASGEFPCHKTAELVDDIESGSQYIGDGDSLHCAGALIFNEKRGQPHRMMRIAERLGMYDRTKLDMTADVQ